MDKNNVHSGHRGRMRKRFLDTEGLGFSEHELLELLLFGSIPRANSNPQAHMLLRRFGSLEKVLDASPEKLLEVEGIGPASAELIAIMSEARRRYRLGSAVSEPIRSLEELAMRISEEAAGISSPSCMLFYINGSGMFAGSDVFSLSKLFEEPGAPKLLSASMLRDGREAAAVAFVRPDLPPIPSASDYLLTKNIASIASSIGIELLDSIIIGKDGSFSMRASGSFYFPSRKGGLL